MYIQTRQRWDVNIGWSTHNMQRTLCSLPKVNILWWTVNLFNSPRIYAFHARNSRPYNQNVRPTSTYDFEDQTPKTTTKSKLILYAKHKWYKRKLKFKCDIITHNQYKTIVHNLWMLQRRCSFLIIILVY